MLIEQSDKTRSQKGKIDTYITLEFPYIKISYILQSYWGEQHEQWQLQVEQLIQHQRV